MIKFSTTNPGKHPTASINCATTDVQAGAGLYPCAAGKSQPDDAAILRACELQTGLKFKSLTEPRNSRNDLRAPAGTIKIRVVAAIEIAKATRAINERHKLK